MAGRKMPPQVPRAANLTPQQKKEAIPRLEKRIAELEGFDPLSMNPNGGDPRVTALEHSIERTLDQVFGTDTVERSRYASAHNLDRTRVFMVMAGMPLPDHRPGITEGKSEALSILKGIIDGLREDLEEFTAADVGNQPSTGFPSEQHKPTRKVFVVHGHDEAAKEAVARFLQQIDLQPIILHEQSSGGRTVIEKIEFYGAVDFVVVLLTPDDVGAANGDEDKLNERARQNVIFELGYFISRLGRERVCALKKGNVEVLSDFAGVVYTTMDGSNGWKVQLAQEIDAAGIPVDFNRVMRP
jgi:predicted nucleotide-binding protein